MEQNRGSWWNYSADDEFVLIHAAVAALGAALAAGGLLWWKGLGWMLQHRVLVPASAHPRWLLPHGHGAGLDMSRIMVVAGVLLGGLAFLVSSARQAQRTKDLL